MTKNKFDDCANDYWTSYVQANKEFCREIQNHMRDFLGQKSIGLDVGAGPGVAARLAANENIETNIIGIEPSKLHEMGLQLAFQLRKANSKTHYFPCNASIGDVNLADAQFNYITIFRASHEIAESLGGKKQFFSTLEKLTTSLAPDGVLIIAEPQYADDITKNPQQFRGLIQVVKEFQQQTIGHSHEPADYITHEQMAQELKNFGWFEERLSCIPNSTALNYVNKNEFNRDSAPNIFYVQTFLPSKK